MPKPDIGGHSPTPISHGLHYIPVLPAEAYVLFRSVADESDTAAVISGQLAYYAGLFQFVYALLC